MRIAHLLPIFYTVLLIFTLSNNWVTAQVDSSLVNLAVKKIDNYHNLLKLLGNPQIGLAKKREIIQMLETEYVDNKETKLLNDLMQLQNPPAKLSATDYFKNVMVHHPDGAQFTFGTLSISKVFFQGARNETYVKLRYERSFKGFNAVYNKKIDLSNRTDVWVRLTERGKVNLRIIGSYQAAQNLDEPDELAKVVDEPKISDAENADLFEKELRQIEDDQRSITFFSVQAGDLKGSIFSNDAAPKDDAQRNDAQNKKLLTKLEKQKIKAELRQARYERRRVEPPRLNVKAGGGMFILDNSFGNLINNEYAWDNVNKNIMLKADAAYRLNGLQRDPDGKWVRAQCVGLFLAGGSMAGRTAADFMGQNNTAQATVDTSSNRNRFFEAETGFVLKEQFRISGGYGFCRYGWRNLETGVASKKTNGYAIVTAGLSPRLFGVAEADFNVSGLFFQGKMYPRVSATVCVFLQTGRF
jgi:hypothetical protein